MDNEELQDPDGWLERCKDCKGKGVVPSEKTALLAICGSCGGECFVPHYDDEGECQQD